MPNAINVLKEDHRKVRELFAKFGDTSKGAHKTRERLFTDLMTELEIHTQIEEEIFYPALRDAAKNDDQRRLYFEATEEHHLVDLILPEAEAAREDEDVFAAKITVLREVVNHHLKEEEEEMFPLVQKLSDDDQLDELGQALRTRKEELLDERK